MYEKNQRKVLPKPGRRALGSALAPQSYSPPPLRRTPVVWWGVGGVAPNPSPALCGICKGESPWGRGIGLTRKCPTGEKNGRGWGSLLLLTFEGAPAGGGA